MQLPSPSEITNSRIKVFLSQTHVVVSSVTYIRKRAAVKTTLTDVDVISVGRSRGRTETDAELIYAAKLHLDSVFCL